MEAAGGDTPWVEHSQTGCVSAVQSRRNGTTTSEIRVRCDCPPKTLMAEVTRGVIEDSEFSLVGSFDIASVGDSSGRGGDGAPLAAAIRDAKSLALRNSPAAALHPVLLAQIGECNQRTSHDGADLKATIQIVAGRLFLRGETILVSAGITHFSAQSQLAMLASGISFGTGHAALTPPTIVGALDQRDQLLSHVSADLAGVCLFYCPGQLQLGSKQTLMRDPVLALLGRQLQLESFARTAVDKVRPATNDSLATVVDVAAATSVFNWQPLKPPPQSVDKTETPGPPNQRTLLLLGGRCFLKGDTLVLLSGILHFCGSWLRVSSSDPVRLDGTSVLSRRLKPPLRRGAINANATVVADDALDEERDPEMEQAMASGMDRPLLLNNVWLYSQGGTVFAGQTPMLTGAYLTTSGNAHSVLLENQERLLARMSLDGRHGVVRLFMQRCKFTVSSGGQLRAVEGVAWMRAKKVRLGPGASEQLIIRDAVAFPLLPGPHEFMRFEGRDLLYKDGLLYLEDLTPLLIGGKICLGQQEVPLHWLSGIEDGMAPTSSVPTQMPKDLAELTGFSNESNTISMLSNGVCLLESTGSLHVLRGRLRIPGGHTILVDQGVAYFPLTLQSNTRPEDPAGFPPPRFVGSPVTRPSDTRQWAVAVDTRLNRATFEEVNLSLRGDGTLWLNDKVPLLKSCYLLLNGRMLSSEDLLRIKAMTSEQMARMLGHKVGASGQMAGMSGQMAGASGQMAGMSGQMAGTSGQMAGMSGQMAGMPGQMAGTSGQMAGASGQIAGGLGTIAGTSGLTPRGLELMQGNPGLMQGAPGLMQGAPGLMLGAPGLMQGAPGLMQGAPGLMQGAPGLMQGAPGLMQGTPGLMQGALGLMQGAPGLMQGAPGLMQRTPGLMQGAPGLMQGAPGLMQGTPGLMQGTPGLMQGAPGQVSGRLGQLMQTSGFTGSYSVFADCKREALVFSLKARFADGLHFLFGP